jgi:hypothetical protein
VLRQWDVVRPKWNLAVAGLLGQRLVTTLPRV